MWTFPCKTSTSEVEARDWPTHLSIKPALLYNNSSQLLTGEKWGAGLHEVKKPGKRGRKPAKIDLKAKLERSRQSARECRARKKLRYQYLEELVSSKERAICALREELEMRPEEELEMRPEEELEMRPEGGAGD
ncbi:hypothetical protein JOQ06_006501, partial [Pogonophryne albipinna]